MEVIKHPDIFKDGYRMLMLTQRSKEGGKVTNPDRVAKKIISRNKEEYEENFQKLLKDMNETQRIYSSVNPRDIEKGIRMFKYRQLDAEYFDSESHWSFYIDIYNRWISSIMAPNARAGSLFLIDIDTNEEQVRKEIIENKIIVVHEYKTKNGIHIITQPFNPSLVPTGDIKKDGLLLCAFNS